eukprot:TRINITY_DN3018_c0_g4_i1.p1 TRINITY_DN3018_c0_g4~~TRINITY_DN3018_c0_g4_i1.p1  ORF type:complete len:1396 (+),score=276.82 TRINITY_DN3018_c0_g4_i1:162-4349(+)
MDPVIVRGLEDKNPERRVGALEQLRDSVRQNNGHFLVGSLKRAFQILEPLVSDTSVQVRSKAMSLLCDIIPELAKGEELETYMPSMLPLIVANMRSVELRQNAESTLKLFVKHTGNLAAVALLLQQHGTRSDDTQMRAAAVKFMPVLVQQVDKGGVDSRLLVLALVERLEDPEGVVVSATIKSLLGIRGMLGETARKYIDSLKLNERKPPVAVPASMTVDLENRGMEGGAPSPVPVRERRADVRADVGFGIVPSELIEALHVEDWKVRAPAVQKLLDLLQSKEDLSQVVPHVKELVQLMITLLNDPNFKISLTSISIIGALVTRLGPMMNMSNLECLVEPLAENFADKKIVIRQESMKAMVKLMKQLKPLRMTELAVNIAGHKNSHVREEIVHLFMLAVMEYGPQALDMQAVVRVFRDGLFDVKDRVRFIAMEAFTLLRANLGQAAVEQFLAGIGQDVVRPLHARFQDPRVPTMSDSGLIDSCFTLTRVGSSAEGELDSPSTAAASPGRQSSGLGAMDGVGQRPRHQSAGTNQHRQIPWKVPTLRSRAGPCSGGGRRNRSAAAAIASSRSLDGAPDERAIHLSPVSCPDLGRQKSTEFLRGEDTAPHTSDAWRPSHENTDLQVEEAMSGLYSSWEGPTIATNKSMGMGAELLLGTESSSWQSLSPATPSSSIFPVSHHGLTSPSPAPTMLGNVEEDSEYASSAKISLWLPHGNKQADNGGLKKGMVWGDFGAQAGDSGSSSWGGDQGERRAADNLRILKSKHKPAAPRRGAPPAAMHFDTSASPPGISSLNIGDTALPEIPEVAAPPARKLTGRLPRKLLKKDGQTPRDHVEHSPREVPSVGRRGSEVMGMGIEGMSVHAHESQATAAPSADTDSRDLAPLPNPSRALEGCMAAITVDKWDTQLDALTQLRQLAVHNPETLQGNIGQIHKDVLNSCNSLRSNLAKNALRCMCDLFERLGRAMDPHIDNTVKVMMNKMTEASGFINGEAERVVDTMVESATDTKVLTSLMAMCDHRHPIIRGKSALFVDRCCQKIGSNIASTGVLDKLLQVLMQYSSDSSQEARSYGKQAIGRLSKLIPTDLERAGRRTLSASQQPKLEQILAAEAGKLCSPTLPGRPRGGFRAGEKRGARDHGNSPANPASVGGLSIDTVSRGSRGSVKGNGCSEAKLEEMEECSRLLKSSDWQVRVQAVDRMVEFVKSNTEVAQARVQQLFDTLEPRLSDNNLKVNIRALEGLQQIIPGLRGVLDTVLLQLVRVVANTIASTNRQVQALGGAAMDMLFGWTDKGNMIAAMSAAISHGNQRVRVSLLDKLTEVVHEVWVEKPQAVSKNVLPLALRYVDEIKHDVRAANIRLLTALQSFMGDSFAAQLDASSLDCKAKVQEMLGSNRSGGTRRTPR